MGRFTLDVSDATFEKEVLERSKTTPVVVDFWAPWCGPCKTLGPLLEKLAEERNGAFVLAKINVDENPGVARAAGVQSIPLVLGVRDGQVLSEFVGAQPLSAVQQFLDRLLPDEADRLAAEGEEFVASGDLVGAELRFRDALGKRAAHPSASLGLARLVAAAGRADEAVTLLEAARAIAEGTVAQEIDAELARLHVSDAGDADETALRERLAADPSDLQARLDLGRLLAARRRYEEALEELLAVVKRNPKFDDEGARKAMVDVFTVLGRENPLVGRYQRELSSALFR